MSNIRYIVDNSPSTGDYYDIFAVELAKKRKKKIISILFITLLYIVLFLASLSFDLFAQGSGGGYAESYIFRNVGARATALAGAYSAISTEPMGIFYNPACLGFFNNKATVSTSVSSLSFDRYHSSIAWGQTLNENFGIGFGINSLSSPSFEGRAQNGQSLGKLTDLQYTFELAMAYRKESVSMGAAIKHLKHNLQGSGIYGEGFALDLGTKFNVLEMFTVGMSVQNIGGMMIWNSETDDKDIIPYTVRTGVAMEFGFNSEYTTERNIITGTNEEVYIPATKYVLLGLDYVYTQHHRSPDLVLGVEAVLHELIHFRGGISLYGDNEGTPEILPMNYWGSGISIRPPLEKWDLPFKTAIDYTISKEFVSASGILHNVTIQLEF